MGKIVNMGEPCISDPGVFFVQPVISLAWIWDTVGSWVILARCERPRLWCRGSEGDTKGFDGVRVILYHIVIFCSFFWRRDRRGVAV